MAVLPCPFALPLAALSLVSPGQAEGVPQTAHEIVWEVTLLLKCDGCRLGRSEYWAQRNTDLVHTISKGERWAGIYEDAPYDKRASGGWLGLAVNCACAALYMVYWPAFPPCCCCCCITMEQRLQQASIRVFPACGLSDPGMNVCC